MGDDEWNIISEHVEDESIENEGQTTSWPVQSDAFFSEFRVRMIECDHSDRKELILTASGFEIYGILAAPQTIRL